MTESLTYKQRFNAKNSATKLNNLTGVVVGLNILIITTIFDGIIFEIVGLGVLGFLLITNLHIPFFNKYEKKQINFENKFCLFTLFIVICFVSAQIIILKLNVGSIIRLYGITKTLFAFPIIYICICKLFNKGIGVHSILPILIIMNYANLFFMVSGLEVFNLFNGSVNYVGAIDIILLPFVLKLDKKISQVQRILFIIPFIVLTVFSGSRSVLLVAIIMLFGLMILEKNKKNKRNYILIAFIVCIIGFLMLLNNNTMVMRAISVFFDRSDAARSNLVLLAQGQFDAYSNIQQLLGSGNNLVVSQSKPVHNFYWEILLTYGKIGLFLWFVWMLGMIAYFLMNRPKEWKYIVLIIGSAILINYVQPFMTTGFLFQIVVSLAVLQVHMKGSLK